MTDKDFKKLSRLELVDIIYELQKRFLEKEEEISALKAELEKKNIEISSSGSIAEAAMKVNGVFETAQAAADQYLRSVCLSAPDSKERLEAAEKLGGQIIEKARQKAFELLSAAEQKAGEIVLEAEKQAEEKQKDFESKAAEYVRLHGELKAILKGTDF